MSEPITKEELDRLTPFERGYAVYMFGAREDQPNVPDEPNPYPNGTDAHEKWADGARSAYVEVIDSTPFELDDTQQGEGA